MEDRPKVRVYTSSWCGYCVAAKRLLDARGISYEELDVSHEPETRRWLVEASGQMTVPQIFFGETSIGGYDELSELDRAGQLMDKLQSS